MLQNLYDRVQLSTYIEQDGVPLLTTSIVRERLASGCVLG